MLKEVPGLPTATRSVCNRRGTGWGTIPARRNPAQGRNDGLLNGVTFNSRRSQNEMVLFSATVPLVAQPGLAPSPVSSTGQALRQERRWGLPGFPRRARGGRVSNPPLQAGTAVGQQHRLPAGGHVGLPLRLVTRASPSSHPSPAPRRGGRVSNPPLQAGTAVGQHHRLPAGGHVGPPLRLVTRASPSSHPSPARHRERGSDVSCLVVLSGWGLSGG